jgi:putative transposase
LANRAGEWPWSAEALRGGAFSSLLSDWPIPRPADWHQWIESRWKSDELDEIRASVSRGRPYGQTAWIDATAKHLGLEVTLRPRGRPKVDKNDQLTQV